MAAIYARVINQHKFKYQTVFSAKFDKQDEDGQMFDEVELLFNIKINHNLKERDIKNIDIKSPLEQQVQKQEIKDSG